MTRTKACWLDAFRRVDRDEGRDAFDLMSPQVVAYGWCICAEHQRKFNSVVLRWADLDRPPNQSHQPEDTIVCPASDRRKGWLYRAKLTPEALACFVAKLK